MSDDILSIARADLARRGRVAEVAEATGIKAKTLRNLRYGATDGMHSSNYEKLVAFYRGQAQHAEAEAA